MSHGLSQVTRPVYPEHLGSSERLKSELNLLVLAALNAKPQKSRDENAMKLIVLFLSVAVTAALGPRSTMAEPAHIVCLTVEDRDNYDAVNFLEDFSCAEIKSLGHQTTIISGNHPKPTRLDGFQQAMSEADLLIVFVRRATPPPEDLEAIRSHLAAGKPLIGIRTANHAFVPLPTDGVPEGRAAWPEFVPDVLGCQNQGYETRGMPYSVSLHPEAEQDSPLLSGVDWSSLQGHTSLYRVLPIAEDCQPLLVGSAQDIQPAQPIAWTRRYGAAGAKIFYTSLGDPADVRQPAVRKLLVNAVEWALQ